MVLSIVLIIVIGYMACKWVDIVYGDKELFVQ